MAFDRLREALEVLRFRHMVWWGRVSLRLTFFRARLRGLPRRARMRLGLSPRKRRASVYWNPSSGGWVICPSGVDSFGIGHEQSEDQVELEAQSEPDEVSAALRAALTASRYLGSPPEPMSAREWRARIGHHLLVSALQVGGSLRLSGWRRVGRDGKRYYEPIQELAGSLAADAPPAAVFALLRELLDRVAELDPAAAG